VRYRYIGYKDGVKVKGEIEASSEEEIKYKLNEIMILELKPIKKKFISSITKKELSKILFSLGLYLKSNISILKAINLVKENLDNPKAIEFLDEVSNFIKDGNSFYDALSMQKVTKLPLFILNSIKLAQKSGKMDIILIEISKFLREEEEILSKTKQALIYPIFVLLISIAVVIFMLTSIVPKIVEVFNNLNQQMPAITRFVINSGNFLIHNYYIIAIFIVIVAVSIHFIYKNYRIKLLIHTFFLKVPILKKLIITKELGRFSYLLYTLSSALDYFNATILAADIIENERIKKYFLDAIEDVKEGKKLSTSLKNRGFIDNSFIQNLALAEESGEVEEIVGNMKELYLNEYKENINILLSLLEPFLIIIIGGVIGFIVIALLLPIFSMNVIGR